MLRRVFLSCVGALLIGRKWLAAFPRSRSEAVGLVCDGCGYMMHDQDLVKCWSQDGAVMIDGYDPMWGFSIEGASAMATLIGWKTTSAHKWFCPACVERLRPTGNQVLRNWLDRQFQSANAGNLQTVSDRREEREYIA